MATLDFIGNPNIRNILFMAEPSGECIAVSTFCRKQLAQQEQEAAA